MDTAQTTYNETPIRMNADGLTVTLEDGRFFPALDGYTLCWSIGSYASWNDQRDGYRKMRAVIRAMMTHRPELVERERREMLKASFDRMFGHNAQKVLDVIEDEISRHNILTAANATETEKPAFVPVIGRCANGSTVWYTGRAGSGFISGNPKDAFLGYSLEGARRCATNLNRMTPAHGVYFVACVGDDAALVTEAK
jgi:hypothetical protein